MEDPVPRHRRVWSDGPGSINLKGGDLVDSNKRSCIYYIIVVYSISNFRSKLWSNGDQNLGFAFVKIIFCPKDFFPTIIKRVGFCIPMDFTIN